MCARKCILYWICLLAFDMTWTTSEGVNTHNVTAGEQVVFDCLTGQVPSVPYHLEYIDWVKTNNNFSINTLYIYRWNQIAGQGETNIEPINRVDTIGHTKLRINGTQIQDGGEYICRMSDIRKFFTSQFKLYVHFNKVVTKRITDPKPVSTTPIFVTTDVNFANETGLNSTELAMENLDAPQITTTDIIVITVGISLGITIIIVACIILSRRTGLHTYKVKHPRNESVSNTSRYDEEGNPSVYPLLNPLSNSSRTGISQNTTCTSSLMESGVHLDDDYHNDRIIAGNLNLPDTQSVLPTIKEIEVHGTDLVTEETHHPEYKTLSARIGSFTGWQGQHHSAKSIAEAGFFYLGVRDCVKCYQCGTELHDWDPGDIPLQEHGKVSPQCEFVMMNTRGSSSEPSSPSPTVNYPQYSSLEERENTFSTWNTLDKEQSARTMAAAGLYYIGPADNVKCHACGIELNGWDPKDDVWKEHKHFSPSCPFVVSYQNANKIQMEDISEQMEESSEHMQQSVKQNGEISEQNDSATDINTQLDEAQTVPLNGSQEKTEANRPSDHLRNIEGDSQTNAISDNSVLNNLKNTKSRKENGKKSSHPAPVTETEL